MRALSRSSFVRVAVGGMAALAKREPGLGAEPSVRFLTTSYEATATPVFADKAGLFQKAGIDVDVQFLGTGASIMSAIVSRAADVGVATPLSLAVAHQRGLPLVAIAPGALYRREAPAQLLIVAKDSPLKTGRDLNGKTVAVVDLRATAQLAIRAWVDRSGGNSRTVNFIEMPVSAMATAISNGHIDAGFSIEPALEQALIVDRVLADPQAVIAPRFLLQIYVTTQEYADEHPIVVKRLAGALRAASDWANSHPSESMAIVLQVAKINSAVAQHMIRSYYADQLSATDLQPVIDLAAQYGALSNSFSASDLIWQPKA